MRHKAYKYAILLIHKESGLYVKRGHIKDVIKDIIKRPKTELEKAAANKTFHRGLNSFEITLKDINEIQKYLTDDKKKAQYWIHHSHWAHSLQEAIKYRINIEDKGSDLVNIVKKWLKISEFIPPADIIHAFIDDCIEVSDSGYVKANEKKAVVKFWKNSKVEKIEVYADNGGRCRICGVSCSRIPHVTVSGKDICYCCLKNVTDKLSGVVSKMNPDWKSEVEAEMFARHLGN